MQQYPFHLVNVFAETHFGGNPLAVFPHADGLNDEQMQSIAQQFNLSETVFIFAPTDLHSTKSSVFMPLNAAKLALSALICLA